jgi:hypothetical protein
MAKKKRGFGRLVGSLTGSPYDRLMSQLEKLDKQFDGHELSRELNRFAKIVRKQVDEERIDEEEHDLLMDEIEEIHPDEREFTRLDDDGDAFYDSDDLPDAPELKLGNPLDLDKLLETKGDSVQGSWASDEYEEYRQRMSEEFFRDSDEALSSGDHGEVLAQDPGGGRVFHNVEDTAEDVKRRIAEEEGLELPDSVKKSQQEEDEEDDWEGDWGDDSNTKSKSHSNTNATTNHNSRSNSVSSTTSVADSGSGSGGADDGVSTDEDGVEWWEDEEGQWWYRPPNEEDWYIWDQ